MNMERRSERPGTHTLGHLLQSELLSLLLLSLFGDVPLALLLGGGLLLDLPVFRVIISVKSILSAMICAASNRAESTTMPHNAPLELLDGLVLLPDLLALGESRGSMIRILGLARLCAQGSLMRLLPESARSVLEERQRLGGLLGVGLCLVVDEST